MTLAPGLKQQRTRLLTDLEIVAGAHTAHGLNDDARELWRIYHKVAALFVTTALRESETRRDLPALSVIDGGA